MKNFQLIETFSGKTIARAGSMEGLRDHVSEKMADHYSVHNIAEAWFAPATILFKEQPRHKVGVRHRGTLNP